MSDEDKRPPPDALDPDAPATPEEEAASRRLRDALEGGAAPGSEAALATALQAAWSPEPIDAAEHAALVDDLPTEEELALAGELRDALASPADAPPIVAALRAAWSPAELDASAHGALVEEALGRAGGGIVVPLAPRRARVLRFAAGAGAAALALAAGVVLWIGGIGGTAGAEAPLARARTTQPLFAEPFRPGETSARIDRIAAARAADYRDNRFAAWGVR